jgi:hypothetical protein
MSFLSSLRSAVDLIRLRSYRLGDDVPLSGSSPVLLLGSAPTANIPAGYGPHWRLVCVNASQAGGVRLGLGDPDLTVLRTHLFNDTQVDHEAVEVLRGQRSGHVLFRGEPSELAITQSRLADIDYGYSSLTMLGLAKRERVILSSSGGLLNLIRVNKNISNGILALFCSLDLFDGPIVMSGFSFSVTGHAYSASNLPRYHVGPDAFALRVVRQQGRPVFASTPEFAKESGLPLWTDVSAARPTDFS